MLFTDLSSDRVIRVLTKVGFWVTPGHGAKHMGMSNGRQKVVIPRHSRLNPYTLKGIIRDAGLTDEQFKNLL